MLRVTESEARALEANRNDLSHSMDTASNIAKAARCKPKLSEAEVTRQIRDFLEAHGWILRRQHVGTFVPLREALKLKNGIPIVLHPVKIGEEGESDWQAIRSFDESMGFCWVIFIEIKAPGKRPRFEQAVWLEAMRRMGYEAEYFDSLDTFMAWYRERYS
jgi:hypothetical protein